MGVVSAHFLIHIFTMILNFCMPLDYFFDSDTGGCS